MPPPTHATASCPTRSHQEKPHHQTPHATTTTTPPNPHQPPKSHPAQPAAAPAEPYALHNPAAVRQHLRGLSNQEVLRLRTSGTTQRICATTLVQAATLGQGVRDFLFDAFLHVPRHDRPPLATSDGESPPPTGNGSWVPTIDLGRHLVRHPVRGRVDTKSRIRYHEAQMAQPPPSATPSDTKEWERETWVARMASLSNFRHHVPGDVPTTDDQQPAPSTYMALLYNLHYTLSTTHYHAPTGHWVVHGTDSLLPADYAPHTHNADPDTCTRGDEPEDPHLWGTGERKSLNTLLSIRSGNQGLGRAMYCLAKWTQRTCRIPTDRSLWKVTLRCQQREAPRTAGDPTPHAPPPCP